MSLNVVKDATCTFCGCVCDDIELHAEGDRIVKARNACSLGDAWFKNHTAERLFPDALIDGKPPTADAAIEAAAGLLYEAGMPLAYGLSNIPREAQPEAVALTTLRALVKKQRVDDASAVKTGLTLGQLQDLADRMKRARFGVLFFGMGVSMTRGKHMNSAAVLTLAAELNAFTKFVCMPMRGHGNVTGSDMVLRWSTGYPFGINLSRGYPRFNPGEFSTVDLLVRGDNDAALILGADPGATMPQPGIDHLARIPTIVLDPKVTHTSRLARVHITTAATGVSAPGTVYRMDEVPLPLRPALRSPYPTDEEVVRRIRQAVAKKPPWVPGANGKLQKA